MNVKKKARKTERADKLQEAGQAAYKAGNYKKAHRKLKKVLRIKKKTEGTDAVKDTFDPKPTWSEKLVKKVIKGY